MSARTTAERTAMHLRALEATLITIEAGLLGTADGDGMASPQQPGLLGLLGDTESQAERCRLTADRISDLVHSSEVPMVAHVDIKLNH